MTEMPFYPTENPLILEDVTDQQENGIRNLYMGIIGLTTIDQRKEIAQHITLEKRNGKFERKIRYDATGTLHNLETMFHPDNGYDLAQEFNITEAGFLSDVLFFHDYWDGFNTQLEYIGRGEGLLPYTVNEETVATAINMRLKYEALGPEKFLVELLGQDAIAKGHINVEDSHGVFIKNAEFVFLGLMDNLISNLNNLKKDSRTGQIYRDAVRVLTERTNSKLRRLGAEKSRLEAATIIPAVKDIIRGYDEYPQGSPARQAISREPITALPVSPSLGIPERYAIPINTEPVSAEENQRLDQLVASVRENEGESVHLVESSKKLTNATRSEAIEELWQDFTANKISQTDLNHGLEAITSGDPFEISDLPIHADGSNEVKQYIDPIRPNISRFESIRKRFLNFAGRIFS